MAEVSAELDVVEKVRAARRRLAESGPRAVRSAGDFERVALPNADADVLRDLLAAERATTVIEVGLAYGASALAIAEALVPEGDDSIRHLIIDAYQDHFHGAGWDAILAAGLDGMCALLPERSQFALPRLAEEGLVADAAFVDGSHVFHNLFVDLYFLREIVRPGGLVILDDCNYRSVATAVRYFEVNGGWQRRPIDVETRLRAFRLPDPRLEPNFEDFEPFGRGD
jgi:predicted O-methyltransferase YrrM